VATFARISSSIGVCDAIVESGRLAKDNKDLRSIRNGRLRRKFPNNSVMKIVLDVWAAVEHRERVNRIDSAIFLTATRKDRFGHFH
jgi:hypothetical protein